jgi:hypothetical protein
MNGSEMSEMGDFDCKEHWNLKNKPGNNLIGPK